jgi:alginate O-acetyltransferase complex protein AlgJ
MSAHSAKIRNQLDRLFSFLFFICIASPALLTVFDLKQPTGPLNENRTLASFPRFSTAANSLYVYSADLRGYFRDNFALRTAMIRLNTLIRLQFLHVTSNRKVILGNDGWLFYAGDYSIDNFTRTSQFSQKELDRWVDELHDQALWLAKRHAKFIYVIAPSKETIYPEHMPSYLARSDRPSRFDQLSARLRNDSSILFVDLRPALIAAKFEERLYHLTDTHWNQRGAFVAYKTIIEAAATAFPNLKPLQRKDFRPTTRVGFSGDLALMLGLDNLNEEDLLLEPLPDMESSAFDDRAKSLNVMIVGDSFSAALEPFFAAQFQNYILTRKDRPDRASVEEQKPDLVITEIVERKLFDHDFP